MSDNFEELRNKEVELQEKQLFAQRVTAASAAATALASARAAASLEEMRREANAAAEAAAEHQREFAATQRAQLAVVEKEAQAAAKEREYQRQVLFLKESDASTKLEAYLEMLKARVSNLYNLPAVPKECQTDGAITRRINTAVDSVALPDNAIKLQSEIKEIEKEYQETKVAQEGRRIGCLAILGVVPLLLGLFGIYEDYYHFPQSEFPQHPRSPGLISIFFGAAVVLFALPIVLTLIRKPKMQALQQQMTLLKETRDNLARKLQPFLDAALRQFNAAVAENMDRWQSVVERALLQSFFDQGLWVEDSRFPERIKAELTQIQKPFPTSCRTDVNNLRPEQILVVYQTFTDTIADLISKCSAVGKDEGDKAMRRKRTRPRILQILRSGPSSMGAELLAPPPQSEADSESPETEHLAFREGALVEQWRHDKGSGFETGPGIGMEGTTWRVLELTDDYARLELVSGEYRYDKPVVGLSGDLRYEKAVKHPGYSTKFSSCDDYRQRHPGCKGNEQVLMEWRPLP